MTFCWKKTQIFFVFVFVFILVLAPALVFVFARVFVVQNLYVCCWGWRRVFLLDRTESHKQEAFLTGDQGHCVCIFRFLYFWHDNLCLCIDTFLFIVLGIWVRIYISVSVLVFVCIFICTFSQFSFLFFLCLGFVKLFPFSFLLGFSRARTTRVSFMSQFPRNMSWFG